MNRSRNLSAIGKEFIRSRTDDIFERDPFKIQSYNFRYAERPTYHMQHYVRPGCEESGSPPPPTPKQPSPPSATTKGFETFYYNHNFKRDDRENCQANAGASSAFQQHRRRKFLNDFQSINTTPACRATVAPQLRRNSGGTGISGVRTAFMGSGVGNVNGNNSSLLRSCCNRGAYLGGMRGSSTTCVSASSTNLLASARQQTGTQTSDTSLRAKGNSATVLGQKQQQQPKQHNTTKSNSITQLKLESKRSSCSGCEININISPMASNELSENVHIKIETDACLVNNTNVDKNKESATAKPGNASTKSAESFFIDKRLSKFAVAGNQRSNHQLLPNRERMRAEQQSELQQQRQNAREREAKREQLRQAEREREHQQLLQLEIERERDRLHELECQNRRQQESLRLHQLQQRLQWERMPMRPTMMPMPAPMPAQAPVPQRHVMHSHLCRRTSNDRLPGMMPFRAAPTATAPIGGQLRAQRMQNVPRKALGQRSSASSNINATACIDSHTCLCRHRPSISRLQEAKLLNVQQQPGHIRTRLNNVPIRISSTHVAHDDVAFSMNQVRVPNGQSSQMQLPMQQQPYNVHINVYADNLRMMRL